MTAPFSRQRRTTATTPGDAAEDNRSDRGQGASHACVEITVFKKSDGILSKTITACRRWFAGLGRQRMSNVVGDGEANAFARRRPNAC